MLKLLLAVVLLPSLCAGAQAQSIPYQDAECDFGPDALKLSETFTFLQSKCLSVAPEERCSCLANEKASNLFVTAFDDNENKILAHQKKVRTDRTKHFWDVYQQMIYGAAFQSEILFSKDHQKNEKVVGCTPEDIAKKFKSKLKMGIEEMKDFQEKALGSKINELKTCKEAKGIENCRWLEKQVTKLQADYDKKKKEVYNSYCGDAEVSNNGVSAKMQLNSAKSWYRENSSVKDSQKKLQKIDCLLLLSEQKDGDEKIYSDLKCAEVLGSPGIWGEKAQIVKGTKECGRDAVEFMFLMEELEEDKLTISITYAEESDEKFIKPSSKCKGDSLCESFERTNQAAFDSIKDGHKLGHGQCIPYSLFLLRKGIPGDLFLAELAAIPEGRNDKLGELLRPPKVVANEQDRQRLDFLKANPLLFKLTQDAKTRESLGRELQKIAKSSANKTPAQKMDNYLKFMGGPVKKASNSDTFLASQAFMCEQMINHFTGIVMATDLPEPQKTSEVKLVDAILTCKVALNNLTSVTDTRNLTDYSDLFRKVEGDVPEISDEEAYKKMNEVECKDLDAFASDNCKGKKMTQAQCAEAYRAQRADNDGVEDVIRNNNVTTNLGSGHFQRASRYSRSEFQDTKYIKNWKKRVGKLTTPAVPFKGKTQEYAQSMQDDQTKVAAVSTFVNTNRSMPSYAKESPTEGPSFNTQVQKSVNPGQIIPSYQAPGTFIPEKLTPTSNVTSAIQDYNWIPPVKRIEKLNQAKDYLQSNDLKNLDDDVEEEKISEINKEIGKQKELSSGGTKFSTNVNTNSGGPTGAANGGGMNGGGPVGGAANISAGQAGHGAINDAIVKIHESTPMQIIPGVVTEKELKNGKLEVTQELLVESSELSELSQSQSALEAYLRVNLDAGDLKEEKIITITDKNGGKNAANLIYRVKFENGKLVVQSIPETLQVKRSVTLKHLKFNLEEFKGPEKKKAI